MENESIKNPVDYVTPNSLAAIWSMMLPGLGQMMKGRAMPGIFWGVFVSCGYFSYFWPGMALHILCILDAAFYRGNGTFISLDTWPKRFSFISIVALLITYVIIRNNF